MLAAAEGDLAQGNFFCGQQGFADDGEGFGLHGVLGGDEVGLFEEGRWDFVDVDELGDHEGVAGGDAEVLDLLGLDGDVLAFTVFVPLDDVILLNRTGVEVGGGDFLVLDAFAGLTAELMKVDFTFGFGGGKKLDSERDK